MLQNIIHIQELVGHTTFGQQTYVPFAFADLPVGTEKLDQPLLAVIVGHARFFPQGVKAVAAVFGNA